MDFEKIASAMTDEEIRATIHIFCEEQKQRRMAQRQKLIDNFHHAFSELQEAGISLKYYDPDEDDYSPSPIYVEKWDNFDFEDFWE